MIRDELIERLERADNRNEGLTFDRDEIRALLDLIRALSDVDCAWPECGA